MAFVAALIGYTIKFVLFAAIAVAGVFIGKTVRDKKDSKNTDNA